MNVFDGPASAFTEVRVLSITNPSGAFAVISVRGNAATFTSFGHTYNGGIAQHEVLFNFVDAESINARSHGFWGTVLAPKAHVTFDRGSFDGGIYARSLKGNAEGHINALHDHDICQ